MGVLAFGCFRAVVLAGIYFGRSFWAVGCFDLRLVVFVGGGWMLRAAGGVLAVFGFGGDVCLYGYGF